MRPYISFLRFSATCLIAALAGLGVSWTIAPGNAHAQMPSAAKPIEITADEVQQKQNLVSVPDGFTFSLFASAPEVNYPAAITATPGGDLFVAVDKNASLDRERGRGQVLKVTDADGDGQADYYTAFIDSVDSPRGLVYDGQTLYVMHPPTLTAYEDTDGDGVADQSRNLVTGLGFDLDFRGADHTTNGMQMGIDGWLYIAVGDYGFANAEGTDGRRINQRGGSIVRVRPDGTELEIYATGLRNVYDIALDPFLNGFERGNTNDGNGWRVRLQHIVPQAEYGYTSLFRNFADEVLPPLADYGGGSGTGALFVDTPHLPDSLGHTLYTVDWGRGAVFQHGLRADGATFEPTQQSFVQVPVPTDMTIDGQSNLYISSWLGASFWYATEDVGFIARFTHEEAAPETVPNFADADADQLVDWLAAPHSLHRLHAQQELLRRGPDADVVDAVAALAQDGDQSQAARVAALFTLKQLAGTDSHQTLMALLDDPDLRASALRALADRKTQLGTVSPEPFIAALDDSDPRARLQAVNGLTRLEARTAAADMAPLVADPDRTVAHVAVQSLAQLGVTEPLVEMARHGSPAAATGAHHVLQRIHTPESVDSLIAMWENTADPFVREKALASLARLYHREADWQGDGWWGTTPSTRGPYFEPVAWSESTRIRPVLHEALATAEDIAYRQRVHLLELNRAVPNASNALLLAVDDASDSLKAQTIRTLVGNASVTGPMLAGLDSLARYSPALHQPVTGLLVAQQDLPVESSDLLRRAALDHTMTPPLRAQALETLVRVSGDEDVSAVTDVHAQLVAEAPLPAPIAEAIQDYAEDDDHAEHVAHFTAMVRSESAPDRKLAYAVLLHLASNDEVDDQPRSVAQEMIADGWSEDQRTASLLWAIGFTQHEDYADEVRQHLNAGGDTAIQEAARYAAEHLGLEG